MKRLVLILALTLLTFLGGEEAQAGFLPSPCIGCGDWQVVGPHGWEGPPPQQAHDQDSEDIRPADEKWWQKVLQIIGYQDLPDTDGWWRVQELSADRVVLQICYDVADDECIFDYCMCKLSTGTWVECPCQ